jgi:transcriptional regulator with XRE-family HTH domain
MSIFGGLGRSLRWLRERQGKRQYQVAAAAGITKAMLSAYETGKQKPSLETLEKILAALGCDLNDLHNAVQIVNERPEAIRRPGTAHEGAPLPPLAPMAQTPRGGPDRAAAGEDGAAAPPAGSLYSILQIDAPLPEEMEQAMSEMLSGFHKLLRYMHSAITHPDYPRHSLDAAPRG